MYRVKVCLFEESVIVKVLERPESWPGEIVKTDGFRLVAHTGPPVLSGDHLDLGDGRSESPAFARAYFNTKKGARELVKQIEAVINKANEGLKPVAEDDGVEVFVFGGKA